MNLHVVINTNFMVAKGTFAAVDSFLGSNVMGDVNDSKEDKEVEEVSRSSSGEGKQKRASETEEIGVEAKIQKMGVIEDTRTVVDMEKINQGTVVACLSRLVEATERNTRTLERIENLLVDNTVITSKNADSTTRLRWAIGRYEKNEKERQEARIEHDRKVSEEKRYEMGRWRKQLERWTDAELRWKEDRKDRSEERDRDRSDSRDSWKHERRDEKENRPAVKSLVLTANNMRRENNKTEEDDMKDDDRRLMIRERERERELK